VNQALALFVKVIKKISKKLMDIQKAAISKDLPAPPAPAQTEGGDWKPVEVRLDDELKEAGDEVTRGLLEKQREMISALDLSQ
jgi:N-acetyltransferase 10